LGMRTLAIAAMGVALSLAVIGNEAAAELVKYKVVKGESIPKSLTAKPGDAKKGRSLAINRKKGNCLACHTLPIPEQPFHGNIGTDLNGVASRMSEGEMRLRIVDPKVVNPDTIMPSFYRTAGFHRVLKKWKGKTVIGAQDVEDIIAYLKTLK